MTEYINKITPTGSAGSKVRPEPDTGNTSSLTLPFGRVAYGNRKLTIAEDKFENGAQVNKAGDVWLEVLEVNGTLLPQPGYIAEIHLGQRWATIPGSLRTRTGATTCFSTNISTATRGAGLAPAIRRDGRPWSPG